MAINFLLNFRLVFAVQKHVTRRAIFYCLVGLFGYALNVTGFHLLYDNLTTLFDCEFVSLFLLLEPFYTS